MSSNLNFTTNETCWFRPSYPKSARFKKYQTDWTNILQVMYANRLSFQQYTYYTLTRLQELLEQNQITLDYSLEEDLQAGTKQGIFLQQNIFDPATKQLLYNQWAYNPNMRTVNPMNAMLCSFTSNSIGPVPNGWCPPVHGWSMGTQTFNDSPISLCPFSANVLNAAGSCANNS